MTWRVLLGHWELIDLDFQQHYGLDLGSGLLTARTGRWLRRRILGLLSIDGRLRRVIIPPPKRDQEGR